MPQSEPTRSSAADADPGYAAHGRAASRRVLCAHWAFSTAGLGLYFPYLSLFLTQDVGLSATESGVVLAVPPLVGMLAQPLWGQLADRTGSRARVLCVLGLGAALGYAALASATGFLLTAVLCGMHALFLSALFPMLVSVSLAVLEPEGSTAFGPVRMWGTIGYFVTVVAAPWLTTHVPWSNAAAGKPGLGTLFYAAGVLTAIGAVFSTRLPKTAGLSLRARHGDTRALLRHGPFLRLLAFTMAASLCLHGPMMLFPLYVRSRGGDVADVSRMWIFMLLFEIPLVARSGALLVRLGPSRTLALATFAGGVRWITCALTPTLAFVYPVQMLHAIVVAGLSVGAALYVERLVPAQLRSTAQSTLVVAGSGVGGMLSSTIAGALVDRAGVNALYLAGGIGAVCCALLGSRVLPRAEAGARAS